jgi:endonuclease/exonuclease/phosphatase family metal-dependent hydrolase
VFFADVGWRQSDSTSATTAGHRIAFWNAAGRPRGWDAASREIEAFDAEIVGVVECGLARPADQAYWTKRFPDYEVELPQHGMAFLVRGQIRNRGHVTLGIRSHAHWWDVVIGGQEARVIVVDLASNLLQPRQALLKRLQELVEAGGDQPVLVMGDFNTPVDAPSMSALRSLGLHPTAEAKGVGYKCTWPVPFPVLTLDQMWTSRQIAVHAAGAGWSWQSDHRPIHAVVTFGATDRLTHRQQSNGETDRLSR